MVPDKIKKPLKYSAKFPILCSWKFKLFFNETVASTFQEAGEFFVVRQLPKGKTQFFNHHERPI